MGRFARIISAPSVGGRTITTKRLEDRFIVPGGSLSGPHGWGEVFGQEGLLDVEIGFGKDEFLLDVAEVRPEGLFVGVDFSLPRSISYLRKIEMRGLTNVRANAGTFDGGGLGMPPVDQDDDRHDDDRRGDCETGEHAP